MRLIDADALLEKQHHYQLCGENNEFYGSEDVVLVDDIEAAPTAEAHSSYTGYIERVTYYSARCRRCGWIGPMLTYCGHCGAKMDARRTISETNVLEESVSEGDTDDK